jgi:hypothetical protein
LTLRFCLFTSRDLLARVGRNKARCLEHRARKGTVDMYFHVDSFKGHLVIRLKFWFLRLTIEVPP